LEWSSGVPSSKGSITGQLQRALAKRDVLAVRSLAGELPSVPLSIAAEITVLLLEREPKKHWTKKKLKKCKKKARLLPT
jgi:hypothetical protein